METENLKMDGCGVYVIANKKNRKLYIGGTINLRKRKNHHLGRLRKNKHVNQALQAAYNRFGEDCFYFYCIEHCDETTVENREQFYLDCHKHNLYNAINKARLVFGENHSRFGKKLSEESRNKIKKARAKQIISHTPETRAKIGRKGRIMDPEHLKKMIAARGGTSWNKGLKTGPSPNKIELEKTQTNAILKKYNSGSSIEELRKEYSYSWDTIKRILIENGILTRNISQQKRIK